MSKKLIRILNDKQYRFYIMSKIGLTNLMSDKKYIEKNYLLRTGHPLDLENPQTFNEKLQWLKLYDKKPVYTVMVDKYEAKKYVAERIGDKHIIPTFGVWNNFNDIDFERLPDSFVLKCTHDSGGLVVVKDRAKFDIIAARKKINASLKRNYFYSGREWPYKNVKPRIIAEQYLENESGDELIDYKFYCFNGEPKFLYISQGLQDHATASISFVNLDWTFAPYERSDFRPFKTLPQKPSKFDEMIGIAKTLSDGVPFLRVDLYQVNECVYFSELTFSPCSGVMPFKNNEDDKKIGSMLHLPR